MRSRPILFRYDYYSQMKGIVTGHGCSVHVMVAARALHAGVEVYVEVCHQGF